MALQAALGQPGVTVAAGPMGRAAMVGGFPFPVAKKTVEKKKNSTTASLSHRMLFRHQTNRKHQLHRTQKAFGPPLSNVGHF